MAKQGISVSEFARRIGVTENAVRSRIKSGKRIAEAVFPDGSLDEGEASALWWVDLDASKMRSQPPEESALGKQAKSARSTGTDFNRVKLDRAVVDLETARINLSNLQQTTVDREVAKRAVVNLTRMNRDAVVGFASRYGPEIADEVGCDARTLIAVLESKLRTMLGEARAGRSLFDE